MARAVEFVRFFEDAALAQLAEQLTLNQRVRGSSPWCRISFVVVVGLGDLGICSIVF